ncbi:MAG: XylR N-terminal domain-containing protein [Candidatus Sabulitectum sp.]|nr:XylR N-terminal domain-containing protein [Candidatus Sabulitectum sp.]
MPKFVNCPNELAPAFDVAEKLIIPLFRGFKRDPEGGAIKVEEERYVISRAESLTVAMKQQLSSVLGSGAGVVIYQIGKSTGAADAKFYIEKTEALNPIQRLSMGMVLFAMSGNANITILPESKTTLNDDFLLVYDHSNSHEAEAHLKAGLPRDMPVGFFGAGYSAGWGSEALGMKLDVQEIACTVMGHQQCRFVMAPSHRVRDRVKEMKALFSL